MSLMRRNKETDDADRAAVERLRAEVAGLKVQDDRRNRAFAELQADVAALRQWVARIERGRDEPSL